jgi:predicted nuclease with TOPRIM domain
MEDKVFELMSKMYGEFTDFRKEITDKVDNNSKELKKLGNQVTRLEVELKNDIKTLYEGYTSLHEKLNVIENKVDHLTLRVDKQDVEIRVIKGGVK